MACLCISNPWIGSVNRALEQYAQREMHTSTIADGVKPVAVRSFTCVKEYDHGRTASEMIRTAQKIRNFCRVIDLILLLGTSSVLMMYGRGLGSHMGLAASVGQLGLLASLVYDGGKLNYVHHQDFYKQLKVDLQALHERVIPFSSQYRGHLKNLPPEEGVDVNQMEANEQATLVIRAHQATQVDHAITAVKQADNGAHWLVENPGIYKPFSGMNEVSYNIWSMFAFGSKISESKRPTTIASIERWWSDWVSSHPGVHFIS